MRGAAIALALMAAAPECLAADCWTSTMIEPRTGYGEAITAPRYTRLRQAANAAEQSLRADPALEALDGYRFQLRQSFNMVEEHGRAYTAQVWLRLHAPRVWSNGAGCAVRQGEADYLNQYAIEINFNAVAEVIATSGAAGEEGEPLIANLSPEAVQLYQSTGLIRTVGQGLRGFRADGGPVLVPLTVGEHLALWERRLQAMIADGAGEVLTPMLQDLRRHRSGLSAAQLQAQLWLDGSETQLWSYARPGQGAPIYQIAPELLRPAGDPSAVRLLTVGWYAPDDDATGERLQAWVARFDDARAAALFSAAGGAQ